MYEPPLDPRDSAATTTPTWKAIVARYAFVAAFPVLLWAVSNPVFAVLAGGGVAASYLGARHGYRLARCFRDCKAMTVDVAGTARITVRQVPSDDPC